MSHVRDASDMKAVALKVPILTTPRLRLEPLSLAHSAGMFAMWQQDAVQKYSGPAHDEYGDPIRLPARSDNDSDKLIRFWIKAAADGWGFRWALLSKESAAFIGHIGFNSLANCSEIAYHLNPDFWGQGLMREAARTAISWRKEGGASQIEAFIDEDNTGSKALALRLGMVATDQFSEGARRYLLAL